MSIQVSESVGIGHPDKIADYISDTLLEEALKLDIGAQFACEVLASDGLIVVAGEAFIRSSDFTQEFVKGIIEKVLVFLGYELDKFQIIININRQSIDIRSGSVESSRGVLSGDQSIVFGYATNETYRFLPLSYAIAADISRLIFLMRISGELERMNFDSKCMVISSGEDVEQIFMSVQHEEDVDLEEFSEKIYRSVVVPTVGRYGLKIERDRVFVNGGGKFVIGGLHADTGITNRKLLVDSYGDSSRHGGGGYSGKDLTKVDRLGTYYARWICKNLVAAGICDSVELQLVYYFGAEEAFSYSFRSDSMRVDVEKLIEGVKKIFPIKFSEIYFLFNQPNIKYGNLARHGHFIDDDSIIPWEKLDKKDLLKEYFGIFN